MQKKTKQIIALVLTVVFIAVIAITIWSCNQFDFSKLKYEGYDFAAISAYFTQTEKDMTSETRTGPAISKINKAQDYLLTVNTQYSLIELDYMRDITDGETEAVYRRVYDEYVELSGKYFGILSAALSNSYLSGMFSEEDKTYILEQSSIMTDDYNRRMSEISALESEYANLEKTVSVTYEEKTYTWETLPESGSNNRAIYDTYMEAYSSAAGDVLISMRDKYNDLAVEVYGEANYADCAYKYVYDRDYTPAQVSVMSDAVKTNFKGMYFDIEKSLSTTTYNSTSAISATLVNRFSSVIKNYLRDISPSMLSAYELMDRSNLYITTTSSNAYGGAFTSYLTEYNVPYIYQHINNASASDISTFIHEFGHFYAFYACNGDQAPMDICEIQSQANEWLFMPNYKDILTAQSYRSFEAQSFASDILSSLQMGCIMDELQQKVYTDDTITEGSQVTALFESLLNEYGAYPVRDDYDFKYWWSKVTHTFNSPFYYISYAMSFIPSLEIYQISTSDYSKAVSIYNEIVNTGAYSTFSGLLSEVNLSSPFQPSTIQNLATFTRSRCGIT